MDVDLVQSWLRHDATCSLVYVNLGGAWLQALRRDTSRFAVCLGSNATATVAYAFAEAQPSPGGFQLFVNNPLVWLHEDVMGGGITMPLWMASSPTLTNYPIMVINYQPHMLDLYERMRREFLSQFQSP